MHSISCMLDPPHSLGTATSNDLKTFDIPAQSGDRSRKIIVLGEARLHREPGRSFVKQSVFLLARSLSVLTAMASGQFARIL
jgi:hypothetical protein